MGNIHRNSSLPRQDHPIHRLRDEVRRKAGREGVPSVEERGEAV